MNETIEAVKVILDGICSQHKGLVYTIPDQFINEKLQIFTVVFKIDCISTSVTFSNIELRSKHVSMRVVIGRYVDLAVRVINDFAAKWEIDLNHV
jgi:hypothetical protein